MREPRRADRILLDYVEARSRLASAPAQSLTVLTGHLTALFCAATRGCHGVPRATVDGWKCSACQKLWHLERVELGRTEIGGKIVMRDTLRRDASGKNWVRVATGKLTRGATPAKREGESRAHAVLRHYGPLLDAVAIEGVHAFAAWWLHVLDEEPVRRRVANKIGAPIESEVLAITVQRRLQDLVRDHVVPPPDCELSSYRVRRWIGWARRRTEELVRTSELDGRARPRAQGGAWGERTTASC